MKFSLEKGTRNIIHSYAPGEIKIQQNLQDFDPESGDSMLKSLSCSLILSPEQLIEDWLETEAELTIEAMQQVLDLKPEVVLLGTGEVMKFPEANILQNCHAARIGVEVMNSAAACRTYNVLAAEGRRVCMALSEI